MFGAMDGRELFDPPWFLCSKSLPLEGSRTCDPNKKIDSVKHDFCSFRSEVKSLFYKNKY